MTRCFGGDDQWRARAPRLGVRGNACANFLRSGGPDGKLVLPGLLDHDPRKGALVTASSVRTVDDPSKEKVVRGWTTYGKTLSTHDAEQQRLNTLLMTNSLLPACRRQLPGFAQMEQEMIQWLNMRYGTVAELFYAHGLRQSPRTLRSTGFAVHQDTEDFDFIEYTIVVKLTADAPGEPPSAMRVVGAPLHFHYGTEAGACGCFKARLYHASVAPESNEEHLKIAFFFRASTMGERRAKRALGGSAAMEEGELAQRRKMVATELVATQAANSHELMR